MAGDAVKGGEAMDLIAEARDAVARGGEFRPLVARLADALESFVRRVEQLEEAFAVLDAKSERETDGSDDEWVVAYRWPCGPFHKALGLSTHIGALSGEFRQAVSRADQLQKERDELQEWTDRVSADGVST